VFSDYRRKEAALRLGRVLRLTRWELMGGLLRGCSSTENGDKDEETDPKREG